MLHTFLQQLCIWHDDEKFAKLHKWQVVLCERLVPGWPNVQLRIRVKWKRCAGSEPRWSPECDSRLLWELSLLDYGNTSDLGVFWLTEARLMVCFVTKRRRSLCESRPYLYVFNWGTRQREIHLRWQSFGDWRSQSRRTFWWYLCPWLRLVSFLYLASSGVYRFMSVTLMSSSTLVTASPTTYVNSTHSRIKDTRRTLCNRSQYL